MVTRMAPSRSAPRFASAVGFGAVNVGSVRTFGVERALGRWVGGVRWSGHGISVARTMLTAAPRAGTGPSESALLLDLRLLATQLAQVVELRATHVATGGDVDVVDVRGCTGKVRSTPTP